jgi:hypothetical protein
MVKMRIDAETVELSNFWKLESESRRALQEAEDDITRSSRFLDEEDLIAQLRQNIYKLQIASNGRKEYIETLLLRIRAIESIKETVDDEPHKTVRFVAKIGIVIFLFSFTIYWLTGLMIVNPIFSLFGIIAGVMAWLMARVDEGSSKRHYD